MSCFPIQYKIWEIFCSNWSFLTTFPHPFLNKTWRIKKPVEFYSECLRLTSSLFDFWHALFYYATKSIFYPFVIKIKKIEPGWNMTLDNPLFYWYCVCVSVSGGNLWTWIKHLDCLTLKRLFLFYGEWLSKKEKHTKKFKWWKKGKQ